MTEYEQEIEEIEESDDLDEQIEYLGLE